MISNNEAVLGPLISLKTIGFMVFMLSHQIMEKTGNYLVSSHLVSPSLLPMSKGGHLNLEGVESVKIKNFHVQVLR